jgi:hypothetical protein
VFVAVWGLDWDDNYHISIRARMAALFSGCQKPMVSTESLILRELGNVHSAVQKETLFFQNPSNDIHEKSKQPSPSRAIV